MKKYIITLLGILAIIFESKSQNIDSSLDIKLAKKFLQNNEYKIFLLLNGNLNYFISTGNGNLTFGPNGLVTYIHETSHIYNNIKSAGMNGMRYYWIDSSKLVGVEMEKNIVPSAKILYLLPANIKSNLLTRTYISCTNNCLSNSLGIYGLVDELNAYSLGAKALCDVYTFFDTCGYTNTKEFWEGYIKCKNDCFVDFYCFSIFISTYLKYLDFNDHKLYLQIISNVKLKKCFSIIYNKYKRTLELLELQSKEIFINKHYLGIIGSDYSTKNHCNSFKNLSLTPEIISYLQALLLND